MTITSRLSEDERRHFIRYTHTRNWPMLQRFPVADDLHDQLLAQMLACSPGTVHRIIDALADEVRHMAAQMLTDRHYREALQALPFGSEDRIVAVGDSVTADRLGWFELLSASADLAGKPSGTMINLAVSANTTADVLERFDLLESARPSHVLLMLGTNDARLHGRTIAHRMVTAPETERNIRALIDLIVNGLGAAATVLTPPAADQRRIDAFFADTPLRWHATDIAEVAKIIREVAPSGLDLHTLTRANGGDLLEGDGVHPTPAGQRLILTQIVDHLAGRPAGR
jgi:lysophospholipase L1-like esterase